MRVATTLKRLAPRHAPHHAQYRVWVAVEHSVVLRINNHNTPAVPLRNLFNSSHRNQQSNNHQHACVRMMCRASECKRQMLMCETE